MGKSSVNGSFSIAMLNNQRVPIKKRRTYENMLIFPWFTNKKPGNG